MSANFGDTPADLPMRQTMNLVLPDPATHAGMIMWCNGTVWKALDGSTLFAAVDADGRVSMDALPTNLTDALSSLIGEQKQTNELLFEILTRLDVDTNQDENLMELPANVT